MSDIECMQLSEAISEISLPKSGVMSIADLEAFSEILERANDDEKLRVLVVRSAATAFSMGVDLLEFAAADDLKILSRKVARFFLALTSCDKLLVAAVDGPCAGLGLTMLLHFDVVLATDASRFSAPFVDLGLVPEAASTLLAVERFGYLRAFDLLCNTREIGVDEALAIGLVGERLGRGELMPAALDRARRLARKPADILRSVRQLLRSSTPISTRISVELQLFEQCLRSTTTRRRLALIGRHVSERDMDAVA